MDIDMEKDAAEFLPPSDHELVVVQQMANDLLLLEAQIDELSEQLKQAKLMHANISEDLLPSKMQELGLIDFTLASGARILIKADVAVNVKAADKAKVHEWLRDNGFGDLVKNTVTAKFSRGEEDQAEALLAMLGDDGRVATRQEKVEPQTLKAFVKEQLEKGGLEFPPELTIFPYHRAVIKL